MSLAGHALLFGFNLCGRDDLVRFFGRLGLRFFNDGLRTAFRIG